MNKLCKYIAITAFIFSLIFSNCIGYSAADVIKINGTPAQIPDGMGQIREKDDRTFVPLRFVSEFLKNEVWYMEDEKSAIVNSSNDVILAQDGNPLLFVTSRETSETKNVQMDTSAYIDSEEGRMYLPIRFLAEAIGYTVGWDEATQTVTLDIEQ